MSTTRLKVSLVFCIIAIILMVVSFFGTWYVWESESQGDDESRVFSREWRMQAAHDSYEYKFSDAGGDEVFKDTKMIDYDSEEYTDRTGEWEKENKFGTDYERTVKTFYLLFFIILIASGISIVFASGIGICLFKNVDRSNIMVIGGLATFLCILPSLLMLFTLGPSVAEDNDTYELEARPNENNYEDLYRYELEGSASATDMSGISGSSNTTFDTRDYSVQWKMGPASYLPVVAGVLSTISTVCVFLTKKEYFSHRLPYHPRNIPAPVYAFFPRRSFVPIVITIAIFFLVLLMLYNPLWKYEYEVTFTEVNSGEELGSGSFHMEAGLESPATENIFIDKINNETQEETSRVIYTDEEEAVMEKTLLFYFLSLGTLMFMIPVMLFLAIGKLDLKNGMPLLIIPAMFLLLTPLYFMNEFPDTLEEEFNVGEMEEISTTFGLTFDGSFEGSSANNTTYESIIVIDSSSNWGPCLGWYILLASGGFYVSVPMTFIVWRKKFFAPRYIAPLGSADARDPRHSPLYQSDSGDWPLTQSLQNPVTQAQHDSIPQPLTGQSDAFLPSSPQQLSSSQQSTKSTPSTVIITCYSCHYQIQVAINAQMIQCPSCRTVNQVPHS